MGLQCGIVGLPNVGKSTLFNCLSSAKAQAANFEPNVGVVNVPDERLARLAEIDSPKRVIPATVEIVDIAGLVAGASKGEGLGNKFLANIRETSAIIHVLRCFDDGNVTHVSNTIDPVRDKEIIDTELQLKDLETLDSRLAKSEKQVKLGNEKGLIKQVEVMRRVRDFLAQGRSARDMQLDEEEKAALRDLQLLTMKPTLYVCNVDVRAVEDAIAGEDARLLVIAAQMESEIAELESYEERQLFLGEMGLHESGVAKLIKAAYSLLRLETYFTTGPDETRAWTFTRGIKAPEAAGIIHTDFQKGFIRAEVIKYADYVKLRSEAACRDAGKISVEGKDYVVKDGDIMHFRFNV